ncbi:TPA: helix-turn-helix transcriptional regulator [Streptococcus suis]|nr:helix-turn-helix transcriptional regulator [Streptococcus suis]
MKEQELRELIEKKYGSVRQFSISIDMPASTINSILNRGILNSNVDNVLKICTALGIRPEVFSALLNIEDKSDIVSIYNKLEQPRQDKVLYFAKEQLDEQNKVVSIFEKKETEDDDYITDFVKGVVAAGHGAFQEDELYMEVKLRAEDVPESYDTIATVVGDSMEPLIHNNDLLFIEITSQVEPNSIGIFRVNGKNFVKKLKRDYDGSYYLQSLNNSYEEIYLTEDDDIRTIGEVVDIYRGV